MKALRSITAATDFSRQGARAVQRAADLARAHSARLGLLHVVDASPLAQAGAILSGKPGGKAACIEQARQRLEAAATAIHEPDPRRTKTRVAVGSVREEILRVAAASDLLVVGARGQHPLRDLLLGSTAERLVQTASLPVLVVRARPGRAYRRVVVPIDFSADSMAAVEAALRIAPGAAITFVHAYEVEFEALLTRGSVPKASIDRFRRTARSNALARIHGVAAEFGIPDNRFDQVVARGYPPRVILDAALRHRADLVAIGKQGRSHLGKLFIGSVTRNVLAEASCDVLVSRRRAA